MSDRSPTSSEPELPVDERLIMPETRYEVIDGEVVYVSPSDEPHGSRHSKLSALLEAHVGADFDVASDMLTRTSTMNDMAPDASVFPAERDSRTGGRQLEELAFEVVSTETLSNAATKARRLVERGVRRVFAIDVERKRGLEWSTATGGWEILGPDAIIDDRTLEVPLPVTDLVATAKADDAMARALLGKRNPVLTAAIEEARAEASAVTKAEAIVTVLEGRGFELGEETRRRILETREAETLDRWLAGAGTCVSADELVG